MWGNQQLKFFKNKKYIQIKKHFNDFQVMKKTNN